MEAIRFLHIVKPIAEFSQFIHVNADAIVLDLDDQPVADGDIDPDDGALRMFQHVVQRFFDREEDILPFLTADLAGRNGRGHAEMQSMDVFSKNSTA